MRSRPPGSPPAVGTETIAPTTRCSASTWAAHAPVARWITDAAAAVVPCLSPLAEPGATARDAAAVAELLASLLAFARQQEMVEPDLIAAEQFLLDTGDDASAAGARTRVRLAETRVRARGGSEWPVT